MTKPATRHPRLAALAASLLVGSGCAEAPSPEPTVHREQFGDTTFVLVTADTAATHRAELDLIVGGSNGGDEFLFSEIADLHVDAEGRLLVFDHMLRSVRRYSPTGEYIDQVGSVGQGPGEFDSLWGVSTSSDGRILLTDYYGRVHVFDARARYLDTWQAPRRALSLEPVVGNLDGTVTVTSFVRDGASGERQYRLYVFDREGTVVDSLTPDIPWRDEEESGHVRPTRFLAWSPTGFGITSVSSRLGFQVFRPQQRAVVRVEQTADRPRFMPEERREWAEYARFIVTRSRRPDRFPPPPEFKPHFKQVLISRTGQVWLVRHQVAAPNPNPADSIMGYAAPPDWIEPFRAEVYSESGAHLASVVGPALSSLMYVSTDTLWGVAKNQFGVPSPVRLVLDKPLPIR